MGFPSTVLSHISKKLEMPAGANAIAFVGNYFSLVSGLCEVFRDGKALWQAFMTGGPNSMMKGISEANVHTNITGIKVDGRGLLK